MKSGAAPPEAASAHLLGEPPNDGEHPARLAKRLEVESDEAEVPRRDACVEKVGNELVEGRRLADLARTAEDLDQGSIRAKIAQDVGHPPAAVCLGRGPHGMRRGPPRVQIPKDLNEFWIDIGGHAQVIRRAYYLCKRRERPPLPCGREG